MIPGAANPLLLASVQAGAAYNIERSVRFNAPDSAYLSRTPSVAGNRKTWTWAGWVKRSALGSTQTLFQGFVSGSTEDGIQFTASDTVELYHFSAPSTYNYRLITSQVFRDCSAWYHLVVSLDTPQATAANRVRAYVNGTEISAFSISSYPAQNFDGTVNNSTGHQVGRNYQGIDYFSGYLSDVHFIDGQALDPTSFGEFDTNGVWQPIEYTGTYGTNGFHLPFSDNSTAAALGTDTSGNSNTWTVNNISVAAGAGNDSLVDTPTSYGTDTGAGGEVRGNYATLNPLAGGSSGMSNGNLEFSAAATAAYGSIQIPQSGKYYFEATASAVTDGTLRMSVGACDVAYQNNGTKYVAGSTTSYGASYTSGDVIGVAVDADSNQITFYKNNVSQGVISHTFGTVRSVSCYTTTATTDKWTVNFGQRPFAYPAPSGFKALCTTNLPEPQTVTTSGSYTGNGVADGPFVYLNGVPTAMTVNGNAVTFGTHADKLSNGFKLRTTSTTYNQNAATYNYSVTSTGPTFKTARAQSN